MRTAAIALALAAMVSAVAGAAAQEFSGSVEARAGFYFDDADLEPRTQELEGRVDGKIGDADMPRAQYSARLAVEYDPASGETSVELGEAWIKLFEGPFDICLGNQIVAWSVSDVFYPSDVVNPWDLSVPIDRKKMSVPLARIILNGDAFSIDLVAQPYWIAGKMPASRWLSAEQASLASLAHDETLDEVPDFSWDNVAVGCHAKATIDLLQGLDLGATFYRGRSSSPTGVGFVYTGPYPTGYYYVYDRATLFGADLTLAPGGDFLLKTEWAYTTLGDASLISPGAGEASAQGVAAIEYTLGTAQIVGEYVFDWEKGSAEDTVSHSVVGAFSWESGSRASVKVAGAYDFADGGSGMVSPQASYTLADGLSASCELFFFFGDSETEYGAYSDNDLGRISLKCFF